MKATRDTDYTLITFNGTYPPFPEEVTGKRRFGSYSEARMGADTLDDEWVIKDFLGNIVERKGD